MKKIRVGAVSYLNTKPLLYGIRHHSVFEQVEMVEGYPSQIAESLINDNIDLGLIPIAAIPLLKEHYIITDYCIGAEGAVASVCLFSEVPIQDVQKVYLDYQSKTSVNLAKILIGEYWQIQVELIDASGEDFRNEISGTTAGVVIGDRALKQRTKSKYIYDLGEAWKKHTGLSFVFAAWVANKKLPEKFINGFNEANGLGLKHLNEVIAENPFNYFDLKKYYREYVSYRLDEQKRKGMELFLNLLPDSI